jgi:hypothetical protein
MNLRRPIFLTESNFYLFRIRKPGSQQPLTRLVESAELTLSFWRIWTETENSDIAAGFCRKDPL